MEKQIKYFQIEDIDGNVFMAAPTACFSNQPDSSKREDSIRMKMLKKHELIGCMNNSGVTSTNYKDELGCGARNTMET